MHGVWKGFIGFIDTEQLIKRRLQMLQLHEDDEAEHIDHYRDQKKREAKQKISIAESLANSRYKDSEKDEQDNEDRKSIKSGKNTGKYKQVISLDSKVHGSL